MFALIWIIVACVLFVLPLALGGIRGGWAVVFTAVVFWWGGLGAWRVTRFFGRLAVRGMRAVPGQPPRKG